MTSNFQKMEIEENQPNTLFQPIGAFAGAGAEYRRITLQSSFSNRENSSQDILLTLAGSTLMISDLNSLRVEPYGTLELNFDLKFEVLYHDQKNVLSEKLGIRLFLDATRSMTFFAGKITVDRWVLALAKRLNQKGFHEMFKPSRKLGKGNFAAVYEVERVTDRRKFAVKAFSKQSAFATANGKDSLINELKIMRHLSGDSQRNLLSLEGVYESDNSIYLILELLEGGQLNQRIQANNKIFTREEICSFMLQLLAGLKQLHCQRIMHRDIKPENIMLRDNESFSPVIVDFGLASFVDIDKYLFFRCGTPGYVAPEIIEMRESKHVEPQCDVFSAGVIFHIILTGKALFEGTRYQEVYRRNKDMAFDLDDPSYSAFDSIAMDLLKKMLVIDPKKRITAAEALAHPYFAGAEQQIMEEIKVQISPVLTAVSANSHRRRSNRHTFAPLIGWQQQCEEGGATN